MVLEVLPNRQYQIRLDGSRRLTLNNRKFLHKFTPVYSHPGDLLRKTRLLVSTE